MGKNFIYAELYEEYKNLLVGSKAETFYLYYCCDLSLGEISQMKGVSRQAVNDAIKKTTATLDGLENALGLLSKKQKLKEVALNLQDCEQKDQIIKLIGEI